MAGCGGGGVCGIQEHREREKADVLDLLARAYPRSEWGALAPEAIEAAGAAAVDAAEAESLGRALEEIVPVRAFVRPPGRHDLGAFVYLLVGLHEPSLFEVCEGFRPAAQDAPDLHDRETYLRVGLSPLGRYATLQEVEFRAERDPDGALFVHEERRLGVVDLRLREVVKALQGALRRRKLVLLDFAFLVRPLSASEQPAFSERYGTDPVLFNFLFDPTPPAAVVTTLIG